jgi:hypothetical protein
MCFRIIGSFLLLRLGAVEPGQSMFYVLSVLVVGDFVPFGFRKVENLVHLSVYFILIMDRGHLESSGLDRLLTIGAKDYQIASIIFMAPFLVFI